MGKILTYRRRARPWGASKQLSSGSFLAVVLAVFIGVAGLGYFTPWQELADRVFAWEVGEVTLFHGSRPARELPSASVVRFRVCGYPPHSDCVIDGDTFYLGRQSIRVADIDAPETHPSRCQKEASLGSRATQRLAALLNAGPFELERNGRDLDQYGRQLRTVIRDGRSLGGTLVSEGLARKWTGRRYPWC